MSPPELAADAPILQVAHPVVVRLRPALRVKLHRPIRHTRARRLLTGVLEEPLLRQPRLNRHIRPLTEPDVVRVILRLHQRANSLQLFRKTGHRASAPIYRYSLLYLAMLFVAIMVDSSL